MNGVIFKAYIERMLAPTLSPGDIVIMDNLSRHKIDGVRQAIEDRGARLLYLPPYSPDLNPIEMAFAKLKALLRKAAERTVDALWDTIGQTLDTFTPQERQNYFVAAGYEPESIESALEACLGSAAHLKSIPIIAANASTPPQRLAREWKPKK